MFSWLKRLFTGLAGRKKAADIEPYYPTQTADNRNFLPLDPENDPWGKR